MKRPPSSRVFPLLVLFTLVAMPAWAQGPGKKKPADASARAKPATVDLNTASERDLESVPGVGPATAKKIMAGRPYSSVQELSRAGVSPATIAKITPLVTVATVAPAPARSTRAPSAAPLGGASSAPVDVNAASEKDLEALPGVGPVTAKKIIAGRPYAAVADLSKAGVPAATIQKIAPLVTAGRAPAPAPAPRAPRPPPTSGATGTPPAVPPPPAPVSPTGAAPRSTTADTPGQQPPSPGMVWVNLDTKVFHRPGDRYYGKTKHGKWMTEAEAVAAGYRVSKTDKGK
ncbi:MAG TPA: helix-hairpin-helix domain-containing protein [Vicinamibacterales bacterium]